MKQIGSELGEVGQLIFAEMFEVRSLPGTVPKSYFYERMMDYVDDDTNKVEPKRSRAKDRFQVAVRKVLGKVRCV
jgi:hypothetical protein